jgi:hypothetical protein
MVLRQSTWSDQGQSCEEAMQEANSTKFATDSPPMARVNQRERLTYSDCRVPSHHCEVETQPSKKHGAVFTDRHDMRTTDRHKRYTVLG